jgi:hypothetical protein
MTVPYCAVKLGRRGVGVELNPPTSPSSRYPPQGRPGAAAAAAEIRQRDGSARAEPAQHVT